MIKVLAALGRGTMQRFNLPFRRWHARRLLAAFVLIQTLAHQSEAKSPPLFDGHSLAGWTQEDGKPVGNGWEVVDGMIHRKAGDKLPGHIITSHDYGDFDLSFEWKLADAGNSGLKYRVRPYDGVLWGCEYQIVDDKKFYSELSPKRSTGALYGLYEPNSNKHLKPPGTFNSSRVVIHDDRAQHWLNGKLIVDAKIGSDDWNNRVRESKFSDLKDFARNSKGKIMLTDHGSEVWFRNFKFTPLSQATFLKP